MSKRTAPLSLILWNVTSVLCVDTLSLSLRADQSVPTAQSSTILILQKSGQNIYTTENTKRINVKQLTEKRQAFLKVLFDEAGGDVLSAKRLAGYSDGTATNEILKALKEEIDDATKQYMARIAPRAAVALGNALIDPTELGIRDKMTAAKDLLDRAGYIKTEKVNVESTGGIFVLPAKEGTNE